MPAVNCVNGKKHFFRAPALAREFTTYYTALCIVEHHCVSDQRMLMFATRRCFCARMAASGALHRQYSRAGRSEYSGRSVAVRAIMIIGAVLGAKLKRYERAVTLTVLTATNK